MADLKTGAKYLVEYFYVEAEDENSNTVLMVVTPSSKMMDVVSKAQEKLNAKPDAPIVLNVNMISDVVT